MKMLLAIAAAVLTAAPSAMASTTTCPTATFNQYLVPNFTCSSGNLVFSGFSYSPSASPNGILLQASSINVTPLTTTADEGFLFTASWGVTTQNGGISSNQDSTIFFTVSTLNHAPTIDDLFLTFNGAPTGTGLASVTEQWCPNGTIPNCGIGNLSHIFVSNPGTPNNATATFSPISSLSISKDIGVSSGTNGTATISTVTNNFSQVVPEPLSSLLLGGGLLGIGLLRKRQGPQGK